MERDCNSLSGKMYFLLMDMSDLILLWPFVALVCSSALHGTLRVNPAEAGSRIFGSLCLLQLVVHCRDFSEHGWTNSSAACVQ